MMGVSESKYFDVHLSLQLLYFPNRSLPQLPYMSPASFTFLKHSSGAGRPSAVKKKKKKDSKCKEFSQ